MNQQIKERSLMSIKNALHNTDMQKVKDNIVAGLMSKQKHISSKFFYDEAGSKLFEKITRLKEYYLSRIEKSILENYARKILPESKNFNIVELGSGDDSKISILLNAIDEKYVNSICYIPVDISQTALEESTERISEQYPNIQIQGIVTDFMSGLNFSLNGSSKLICFFGSTIGNLTRKQSSDFVLKISKNMQVGDKFLLGLDMVKDKRILEAAYNDNKNVTAEFNKNILKAVNNTLDTNFNTNDFEHYAPYNEEKRRIEMHLTALKDIQITSPYLQEKIMIKRGETIHTENSHKYTIDDIENFTNGSKLKIENIFSDSNGYFSLVQFIKYIH